MSLVTNFKFQKIANLHKTFGIIHNLLTRTASSSTFSSSSSSTPSSSTKVKSQDARGPFMGSETYGQPTFVTHPHLINEGELVPCVTVEEFRQRRQRLMQGIQQFNGSKIKNDQQSKLCHLVIVPSSTKKYMSDKIPYVFRQNSDFYYLTGCLEPDTVLVMHIDTSGEVRSTMFMRPKDKNAELWDGARTGVDKAVEFFGVDEAYASDQFNCELTKRLDRRRPVVWYDDAISDLPNITKAVQQLVNSGNRHAVHSPTSFIHGMRLFKSLAEQRLMRHTCQIASQAINEVMCEARPGHSEHHIFAMVDYKCRMNNASYLAYPPVVASGSNATTIHYINNTQLTRSGDLVLMDAGCEYGGYTSDVTRTWPISGEFSKHQAILYDVILTLQRDLIATLFKEGGETLDKLFDTMCVKLGKYLQEVGIVPKDINDDLHYAKAGYKFCPHHVSHYLGMDVHDTPLIPRNLKLQPGMVFTVEPGIYIGKDCDSVPKEFRGIGVRVEDDLLVSGTEQVEILTDKCIKDREQMENLFKMKS